jgi:quercetin dioxygenase-like cupin family protein
MSITASTTEPGLTTLPEAAQLQLSFEAVHLQADLDRLDSTSWRPQRSYGHTGLMEETSTGWRCLPLRSPGGDAHRSDPGGAGLEEFKDTAWLERAPYLRDVLSALPAPLRGARLMRLDAGTEVAEHRDSKCGLPYGTVRLHVPIVTHPAATLTLDGRTHCWQHGTLWYADFQRPHSVRNDGTSSRVHLVIDSGISPQLLDLFPPEFLAQLPRSAVLFASSPIPLLPAELPAFRCQFTLPASFLNWSEESQPDQPDGQPYVAASVDAQDARLVLCVDDEPAFTLIHIGAARFRLAGWTDERVLHIANREPEPHIRLLTRHGSAVREQKRPVGPAPR